MVLCGREHVQRGDPRCRSPFFDTKLFAKATDELWLVADCWKHTAKKEQISRLDTFYISAKRSGRRRKLDAELRKPALCARRLRALRAYHLPECEPPSTCSTSPVTLRASVR